VTLKPRRVLETAVYCDDLARTTDFYRDLLAAEPMLAVERVVAFDAGEGTVLLLFQRGASDHPFSTPGGLVPGHTSTGPAHIAFAIDQSDVPTWLQRLQALHIAVESRVDWPRGGQSIYFRDPDGRSVELATPGTWASY
jgi:catechol 2,3-dioxygenase-like lactoylglutathione lyase family enzyme